MTKLTGGCLCGAVRYVSDAQAPVATAICHCRHCQKQSGTAFSIVISVRTESLSVEGEMAEYRDTGSSGQPVFRRFCPRCGSPLISELGSMPKLRFIKAGTLDDPSWLQPQAHVWCDSAQPWVPIDPDLPRYARDVVRAPK